MTVRAYPYEFAHTVPCEYCGAKVDEECVTNSGRKATWPHNVRTWALSRAHYAGYEEAVLDHNKDPENFARWARGWVPFTGSA